MTNQNHSDTPSTDSKEQSLSQAPVMPAAPQEGQMSEKSDSDSGEEKNVSSELAREFRWVEFAQIASNVILAIVGIIALCIYNGQLKEMRKSTKAAQDAAIAAKSASETANTTLKSSQKSFEIDQRPYLVSQIPEFAELPTSNKNILANETIKNIGRTPAIKRLSAISLTRFDPGSKKKLLKFLQSGFEQLRVQNEASAKQMESYASTIPDAEMDVAPQDSYFGTNQNSIKLSEDELKKLRDGTGITLF